MTMTMDDGDDDDDDTTNNGSIAPRIIRLDACVAVLYAYPCTFYANSDVNEWKLYSEVTLRPFQLRRSYDAGAANKKRQVALRQRKLY